MRNLILFAFGFLSPYTCYAEHVTCKHFFKNGHFTQAAACFLKMSEDISLSFASSPIQRYRKGRLLRNAAICLEKAAKQTKRPELAAFLRERGANVLGYYLQKKLFEINIRAQQAKAMRKRLQQQIQYAELSLQAQYATSICLRGFRWKQCFAKALWRGKLRPGKWSVHIVFSNKAEIVRDFSLSAKDTKALKFKQPIAKVKLLIQTGSKQASLSLSGGSLEGKKQHKGSSWRLQLLPGKYTLSISFAGQKSWIQRFVLHRQKPQTFIFQPNSPGVELSSAPSNATIRLNGVGQGKAPLRLLLQSGAHHIEAKSPCYEPSHRKISFSNKTPRKQLLVQKPGRFLRSHRLNGQLVSSQRTLGVASLVAGGSFLALGVVSQFVASSYHGQAIEAEQQFQNEPIIKWADDYRQRASTGNTWRTIGTVGLGVAAVGLSLGVWRMSTLPKVLSAPKQCHLE